MFRFARENPGLEGSSFEMASAPRMLVDLRVYKGTGT
jgi:hypothetical protein